MIISVNWLKLYTEINKPIDELVELIGSRLVEVESVTNIGEKYKGIVIAKVIEAGPIEGTDHLNLVKIDDGKAVDGVDRDDNGYVQVVCGAPNVRAGIFVAWLPPGTTVPSTYGSADPLVLSKREIRGNVSNGMLASRKELDLADDHEGIMEIPESAPGRKFDELYQLDDFLLDIENKSLTHRPDCFGVIGFAREVAAIQGKEFTTPEWLAETDPVFGGSDEIEIKVSIDDPDLSEKYQAVVLAGLDNVKDEFPLTPTLLARSGVRSVSPVVDVTNYLMLETGQPLHAFDYDKLLAVGNGKIDIHVRAAKKGEKLELLDGRVIELDPADIVIANGETPVALAGAMGGANTEIDNNTKNILIESATFNLYKLRSTQMRHGIFSEAITRFTKGQPAQLTSPVLAQAIRLISSWTGAKQIGRMAKAKGNRPETPTIEITVNEVNNVLGTAMNQSEIEEILLNVEFATVESGRNVMTVSPPYWRRDIHIKEDVIEEIGRISGFDSINPTLPLRTFKAVDFSKFDKFRTNVRKSLASAGANEVLTYSFVHGDLISKAGQDVANSYRITNSLSPDLQYYRQSLTPSLISLVHPNLKQGYEEFALFEINKVHPKNLGLDDESVPVEQNSLSLVVIDGPGESGSTYYKAKHYLEYLSKKLAIKLKFEPLATDDKNPVHTVYEPKRSAMVLGSNNEEIGVVGEFRSQVIKGFKLPVKTAGFEVDLTKAFASVDDSVNTYKASSKYPGTYRDICFKVTKDLSYAEIETPLLESLGINTDIESAVSLIDIYSDKDSDTRNITVRVSLVSVSKTLTGEEANNIISAASDSVVKATGAKVV